MRYRHDQVARVCYAALRQLREEQGGSRGPVWDLLTDQEQQWYILLVELARQGLMPVNIHGTWCARLIQDGWTRGGEISHSKRVHPELTEWSDLTAEQRMRYTVIQMNVNAMTVDVPAVWGVGERLAPVTAL